MISLAAWMTVSTSALSKLRTTKRPRWAGGTGGAVGGCGIRGGGLGSAARCAGGTRGGATAPGGGVCAGGLGLGAAHPEARASRTTLARKRLTLVLRHRLGVVRVHRRRREPSAEARRGPGERRGVRKSRRRLPGLYHLGPRRKHAGDGGNAGCRLRDLLNGAGHLPRWGGGG